MKKIIFITIVIVSLVKVSHAQLQANIWNFGDGLALDFSSGSPVSISGSSLYSFEGSASYCDRNGNFLFYTNGGGREPISGQDAGHIWDRTNAVMYDMKGVEGGGMSSAQSAVIFEAPGQDSVYYVFTMDEQEFSVGATPATIAAQPYGRGCRYFIVDMRLNGGLGGVPVADQLVEAPSNEALCAIRHSNKTDYWVLIQQDSTNFSYNTKNIGVYKVTSSGVTLNSVFQNARGAPIKASPDGRKVATDVMLMDFNNTNGVLSNPDTFVNPHVYHEFSPNSRFLYTIRGTGNQNYIYRYDMQAANVLNSETFIYTLPKATNPQGQMQLAPDGKIYFSRYSFSNAGSLHRIKCPNTFSATVELNVMSGGGIGLPNYAAWLFENYDSLYVSLGLDTINFAIVPYTLNAGNPGAAYSWSTGETTQTISINSPGKYWVTVTGDCGSGSDTVVVLETMIDVGTKKFINENSVSIYPNPAIGQINVKVLPSMIGSPFSIYDRLGKVVLTGRLNESYSIIPLDNLPGGIYLFRVGENVKQILKVIKE